jgi:hypothetical protein
MTSDLVASQSEVELPKLVFSKSLEAVEGNARLSRADPVQTVQVLKEEDGGPSRTRRRHDASASIREWSNLHLGSWDRLNSVRRRADTCDMEAGQLKSAFLLRR